VKRTKTRILYTFLFYFTEDSRQYVKTRATYQLKARVTYRDRVPIKVIPRADRVLITGIFTVRGLLLLVKVRK